MIKVTDMSGIMLQNGGLCHGTHARLLHCDGRNKHMSCRGTCVKGVGP